MEYNLDINDRAFRAIKDLKKRIEIRTTKIGNHFDYKNLKVNDTILFTSYSNDKMLIKITDINWYESIEKLLTMEGTKYTLSSTDDYNEGIKSINNISGYKDAIRENGVYAIHIKYLEDK